MGKQITSKAKLVIDYCKKYPEKSTRALAELLSAKYDHLFTYQQARDKVRYFRNEKDLE